jgi:hypothetical protein
MEIRQRLKSLTSDKSFQTITLIFTAFVAFKLYFLIFPVDVIVPEQATAFSWPWVILIIVLGYLGYFISLRLDIARIRDVNVSNFKRFGIPAITGFIYGVITVFNDYREHAHHPASNIGQGSRRISSFHRILLIRGYFSGSFSAAVWDKFSRLAVFSRHSPTQIRRP